MMRRDLSGCLDAVETIFFDCDGVLWRGNEIIEGANDVVKKLKETGKRVVFVTNNSTKSRESYKDKFLSLGFEVEAADIVCAAYAAAVYVKNNMAEGKKVYVVGEKGIQDELENVGLEWIGGENHSHCTYNADVEVEVDDAIGAVVAGLDTRINYYKLVYAFNCLKNTDTLFVATNRDSTFPSKFGLVPGGGSLIASLVTSSTREPTTTGKPEPVLLDLLLLMYKCDPSKALFVGDRLNTDILFGNRGGMKTLLVMTGVTDEKALSDAEGDFVPDYVTPTVTDLLPLLK